MQTIRIVGPLLIATVLVAGCASHFTTRDFDASRDRSLNDGIAYYEAVPYLVTSEFSELLKADGTTSRDCTPTVKNTEIQSLPARKKVIVNRPSEISTTTFAVTLNANGTLASVNAVSTPAAQQFITTAETALLATVTAAGILPLPQPPCNASPRIRRATPMLVTDRDLPTIVPGN